MNCKLCGYYYSSHEQGNTCQHCGGNREGLHKTRLMTVSKIIALIAVFVPVFFQISTIDFKYEYLLAADVIDSREGHSGVGSVLDLVWVVLPFVFLFTISALFRVKRCNFGLYLVSAVLIFPFAVFFLLNSKIFIYFVSWVLFTLSAIIAKTDRKKQIKEYKKELVKTEEC
ncbi:MAG: hypothetical protein K2I00_03125 [Ruminococcus sp.]|nr:hypothetical protein [Ruminococcus sp.]